MNIKTMTVIEYAIGLGVAYALANPTQRNDDIN
jgi:hypothetical protein